MTSKKNKKIHISWMLFDNATVGFFTLVLIFIYGPYFVANVASSPKSGQEIWGFTIGAAGIFVALLSPVLGAIADVSGRRKIWLLFFSTLLVGGLLPLYFFKPFHDIPMPVFYISLMSAFIGVRLATSFTNAMIPQIVDLNAAGRLSGNGVAIGNTGSLFLILLVLGFMVADPFSGKTLLGVSPILGIDPTELQGERLTPILAAVWYMIFVIPLFLFIPDSKPIEREQNPVSKGLKNLYRTVSNLHKRPSYSRFLLAVVFYRNGISSLFAFGGIYAAGVLKLSVLYIGIFGILAILFGAIGGWIGGRLDQRYGAKNIVLVSLLALILCCVIVVSVTPNSIFFIFTTTSEDTAAVIYLTMGALAGAASNSALASSRTLLVRHISEEEATEAFGIYELASRCTAFTGPIAVAFVTSLSDSQRVGIVPIILLLIIGVIILSQVEVSK